MNKFASIALVVLFGQLTYGQINEVPISAQCHDKITKFSTYFANASIPFYGTLPVTIGKVEVNSKAIAAGESGFADGRGTYEVIMDDEGTKETSKVEFKFQYMTEPHCAITSIKLSDSM